MQEFEKTYNISLKETENFALLQILDPGRTEKITKVAFIREMGRAKRFFGMPEIDIEIEMRNFK